LTILTCYATSIVVIYLNLPASIVVTLVLTFTYFNAFFVYIT